MLIIPLICRRFHLSVVGAKLCFYLIFCLSLVYCFNIFINIVYGHGHSSHQLNQKYAAIHANQIDFTCVEKNKNNNIKIVKMMNDCAKKKIISQK